MRQRSGWGGGAALLVSLGIVLGATPGDRGQPENVEGWRAFEASWSASGERYTLDMEQGRVAVILRVSGALVLRAGGELRRGFKGEAIAFDDGRGAGVGRVVWTDDRGDRIFSDLAGQPAASGHRLTGTFTGGTGRYAGLSGSYEFAWDYVLPSDEGRISARAVVLSGRYRGGAAR